MYVAVIPNRGSPPAILLRESYREAGKTKNRTLANLSGWPAERIEQFRAVLRGDKLRKAPAPLTRNDRAKGARRRRSWRGAFDAGARCELIALRRRVELGLSDYIG